MAQTRSRENGPARRARSQHLWSELLEGLRIDLRLTVEEFAAVAGVGARTAYKWRRGDVEAPHDARLSDLADRLDHPPDDVSPNLRDKIASGRGRMDFESRLTAVKEAADVARMRQASKRRLIATAEASLEASAEQLRQLLARFQGLPAAEPALRPMTSVFTQDFDARVRFEQRLLEDLVAASRDTNRQPLLSSLASPAFVTRPWEYQSKRQARMYPPAQRRQIEALLSARYEAWHALAETGRIRWLIDRRGHEEHFAASLRLGVLTEGDLQTQIANTLSILNRYPDNLEVALQEDRIPTTYSVFGYATATIFGHVSPPDGDLSLHGIRGVVTQDPATVVGLRLSFEVDWSRSFRSNSARKVRAWLASLGTSIHG